MRGHGRAASRQLEGFKVGTRSARYVPTEFEEIDSEACNANVDPQKLDNHFQALLM